MLCSLDFVLILNRNCNGPKEQRTKTQSTKYKETKYKAQRFKNPKFMTLLRELLFPLIAVVAAFIVGGILILIIGDNPLQAYALLFGSALSWPVGIGYTLFYATPLIFTGLAVLVAFRCGLLNIGAEGQLYIGAFATAWVGITFANLSPWLLIPLCFVAAILGGGVWGAIPGVLKARFGSHEVINTIMLNFIAVALLSYFTQYHYKTPGDPIMETVPIGAGAHIARLGKVIPGLPEFIPLNVAFVLALDLLWAGLSFSMANEMGLRIAGYGHESQRCRVWRHLRPQADHRGHDDLRSSRGNGRDQ